MTRRRFATDRRRRRREDDARERFISSAALKLTLDYPRDATRRDARRLSRRRADARSTTALARSARLRVRQRDALALEPLDEHRATRPHARDSRARQRVVDVDAARQQRALVRLVVGAKPRRERVRDLGIRRRASRRASRRARSRVSRRRGVAAAL